MKVRAIASGLALLSTLVAVGWAIDAGLFGDLLSESWIDLEVRGKGASGQLLFVAVAGAATCLALPRHVVSFLAGYAFGVVHGTLLGVAGAGFGCVLTFYYARALGRPLLSARIAVRVRRMEDFVAQHPFWMTVLLRLIPVGNNFATNLAAGVSRIPAGAFFVGSLVGYLPLTVVFALAGSGVDLGAAWRIGISVVLLLASGAIGAWLYRKYRDGRTLGADVDEALDKSAAAGEPPGR